MSLQRMRRTLRVAIADERHQVAFALAQRRQPALATCPTAGTALSRLAESSTSLAEKEALIRALIAELQRDLHPLWSSMSFLACYPMLGHLRSCVRGDAVNSGDLDQLIVTVFLEVLAAFPLERVHDRIFLRLRQKCRRRLFRHVRREQHYQETIYAVEARQLRAHEEACLDQGRRCYWPETRRANPARDPAEVRDQLDFLTVHAGDLLEGERLDLVIATMVHGERLRHYIERQHPDLEPDEHERAYQRIKRRHSRVVTRLREHLAHLRCDPSITSNLLQEATR